MLYEQIKKISRTMLQESVGDDALESFSRQLTKILNENKLIGRKQAENEIYGHLLSALKKYFQIILIEKKGYLAGREKAWLKKWRSNINKNILNQLEKSNNKKKGYYFDTEFINKMMKTGIVLDAYEEAVEKVNNNLDYTPKDKSPKVNIEMIYLLVDRPLPF